jgi:hypothetical protein
MPELSNTPQNLKPESAVGTRHGGNGADVRLSKVEDGLKEIKGQILVIDKIINDLQYGIKSLNYMINMKIEGLEKVFKIINSSTNDNIGALKKDINDRIDLQKKIVNDRIDLQKEIVNDRIDIEKEIVNDRIDILEKIINIKEDSLNTKIDKLKKVVYDKN